jgi:hypothetical protein
VNPDSIIGRFLSVKVRVKVRAGSGNCCSPEEFHSID